MESGPIFLPVNRDNRVADLPPRAFRQGFPMETYATCKWSPAKPTRKPERSL